MRKLIKGSGFDRSRKEKVLSQSLFRISERFLEIMQSESEDIHKIFEKHFANESFGEHWGILLESERLVDEFDEAYKKFIELYWSPSLAMEVANELLHRLGRSMDIGSVKLLIHALEELFYSNSPQIEQ